VPRAPHARRGGYGLELAAWPKGNHSGAYALCDLTIVSPGLGGEMQSWVRSGRPGFERRRGGRRLPPRGSALRPPTGYREFDRVTGPLFPRNLRLRDPNSYSVSVWIRPLAKKESVSDESRAEVDSDMDPLTKQAIHPIPLCSRSRLHSRGARRDQTTERQDLGAMPGALGL